MKTAGLAGKDYLIKLLEGKEVIIKTAFDNQIREKYGRLLIEVYLEKDGSWININDEMVKLGYAIFQQY
jgi:endonuclease YncB( thermonuclease family)